MPIDVDALSYSVSGRIILNNIALAVPDGSAVRIRGRTGSGKSTFGQLLARRIPAPALPGYQGIGRRWRWVEGQCFATRLELPATANYLAADPYENLIFPAVRDAFPQHFSPQQIRESLASVGLDPQVAIQDTWQLSGGMLQRLCLARAQAYVRPLIVADQLYEWLDQDGRNILTRMISRHAERGGVVVALESTASPTMTHLPLYTLEPTSLRRGDDSLGNEWEGDRSVLDDAAPITLEVKELVKHYRRGKEIRPVIAGLSFSIRRGEWLGICGSNGVGKSVLAKIIAGIEQEDTGSVLVGGNTTNAGDRRRDVAYLFQLPSHQLPFPTVNDHVHRLVHRATRSTVNSALAQLGIAPARRVAELTPHQQRMLVLSLLIVRRPRVVIVDEPTWGADRAEVLAFISMLRRIGHDTSVILISHDHQFLFTFANRLAKLEAGKIADEVVN